MTLAFVPQHHGTTIILAIIVENLATSLKTARIQGSIIQTSQEPLWFSSSSRTKHRNNIGQNAQKGKADKKSGQVFYTQAGEIPEGEPVMMGMFPIAKHPTVMLFDSGASHSFINRTFVIKHEIPIMATKEDFFI
jgi:hypothetical protein